MKEVIVVRRDGSVEKMSVDRILSRLKRENGYIVVEYRDFFDPEYLYVFPGLIDIDLEGKEFVYTFKKYMGAQKPRLYPKCEIVERGADYLVVQRHDGTLFKINHAFPGEVLLNIVNNPGIPFWDLVSLEVMIAIKEHPDSTENDIVEIIEAVLEVIGFYIYILDLVEIKL